METKSSSIVRVFSLAPVAKERREFAPWAQGSCEPEPTGAAKICRALYPVCAREFAPKGARLCEPEPTGAVKRYIVFYIPVCACGKREAGVCAMGARLCEPEPTGAVKISYFISPFAPVAKERREFAPWEQGSASPNRQARQDISRRFVPVCACGKREAGVCA